MIFDKEETIRRFGGSLMILESLLEEFQLDTENQIKDIRSAITGHDSQALEAASHALKGASANMGAEDLSALAKELEISGKSGSNADWDVIESKASNLPKQLALYLEIVQKEL